MKGQDSLNATPVLVPICGLPLLVISSMTKSVFTETNVADETMSDRYGM